MSQFTSPAAIQTVHVDRSRIGLIALWAAQLALAGMFFLAGGSKLAGVPAMVGLFDAVGVGQWFRYVTGLIEVGSAVALLVPSLAPFGALALVATMAGAILTHLFIVGGSPLVPAILLVGSLTVAWSTPRSALERSVANALTGRPSKPRVLERIPVMTRRIAHRTRGQGHGPIVRLMSPSDLGEELKPFVFLDLFEADMRALAGSMPVHPHSGIATVTVFADGDVTFDDPQAGHGILGYGGVEWARAGRGMWHGKELSAGTSPTVQGFQLWLALPPALENAESEAQYIGGDHMPRIGPARLIVGAYQDATSPVRAPDGINYLLVTLKPGERWTYTPPAGHVIAWVAVSKGALTAGEPVAQGELAIFEKSETPMTFEGAGVDGATFVVGSAIPHAHPLHLGSYSVHTSAEALAAGERHIRSLKQQLDATGDRRTRSSGSTPVFRG